MKNARKLIPALAMLLVSAILMTTASYAWFSMNDNVTVSGMQVTAKSDSTYLLIGSAVTGETDLAKAQSIQVLSPVPTSISLTGASSLFPASPALTSDEAGYLTVATGHNKVGGDPITTAGVQVTNKATAADFKNWFTASALASSAATIDTTTAKQLTSFTDYVDVRTVYLTVAAGANSAKNLKVIPTFAQEGSGEDLTAVKAIVTTSAGGYAAISSGNNGNAVNLFATANAEEITSTAVLEVTVYIYVDGDETPIFTNNSTDLTGVSLSLKFTVEAYTA